MPDQTLTEMLRAAWPLHRLDAATALDLLYSWCSKPLSRVPGIGTAERLAVRIYRGKSIEQAAAAEYLYRWHLAVKPFDQCGGDTRNPCCSVFGTPHTIGL